MVDSYSNKMVVQKPLNGPRASGEEFGAGIGRAFQGVGNAVSKVSDDVYKQYQVAKQKEDISVVVELENELSAFNRVNLNEGAYTLRGKNAFGAKAQYEKELEKFEKNAQKRLQNDDQKQLFTTMFSRNRNANLNSLSTHEQNEKMRWQDETTVIASQRAIDDSLANYSNDELVEQSYKSGLAAIKTNYFGRDELMGSKVADFKSEFFKMGVLRRADDDADGGRSYYEEHKQDILGRDHSTIEEALKKKKIYQEELPIKLKEKEMKMVEYEIKLGKFEKQKGFDDNTRGMSDVEALKYLENNEADYSPNWYKAKQKSLLSAKGITSETRKELASDFLLKTAQLSSLTEDAYLREADDLLTELEDEYGNGAVTLQDKIRLQNQIFKTREVKTVALADRDDDAWINFRAFDWKDANERIIENVSSKREASNVMLDYFRAVDGKDLDKGQKKEVLDGIVKQYNSKNLNIPMFRDESEVDRAFSSGKIKKGDTIYINGRRGVI